MPDLVPDKPCASKPDLISRIRLIKGDIARQTDVEAIVTSVSPDLNMRGSLNSALIAAAGEKLDNFILDNIYKPQPGDAFALPPFNLPVKHIICVMVPVWRTDFQREDRHLIQCYRNAMQQAHRMGIKSIAFPALGTGKGKYPIERAARLAIQGIRGRQIGILEEIRIICDRDETYDAFLKRLKKEGWKEGRSPPTRG